MKPVVIFDVRTFVECYNDYVYEYGGETITPDEVYDMINESMKPYNPPKYYTGPVQLECGEFENFANLLMCSRFKQDWAREAMEYVMQVKVL